MHRYWIAPADSEEPLVLGADRRLVEVGSSWELFREKLYRIDPRLLPMVKASILPADPDASPDEAACGSETGPVYQTPGPLSFGGGGFGLSSCGRAFVDRLPDAARQEAVLSKVLASADDNNKDWTELERSWLELLHQLAGSGRKIMLIREDGWQ
jgi:hypothetical protein